MLRVTVRSLWEHKRRLISTIVAILLGVAFMSGTFVLSDTLDQVFDDLFAEGSEEIDAQVQGEVLFSDPFMGDQRALLDPSVIDAVRAVPEVDLVEGFTITFGGGSSNRVLGADGEPIGSSQGPPTLIESWLSESGLSPYVLKEGRGPEADGEVAMNVAAVEEGELSVGSPVTVVTQFGRKDYTLVGTFLFGTAESAAGAVAVDFTPAEAQRVAGTDGRVSNVYASAKEGVSQEELVAAIAPVLSDGAEVLTGEQAAAQLSDDVQSGFQFFRYMLTIFAFIALLVGVFVISNTFAILVAQRTRELALLRAVGAGRGQVMRSVLVEAGLVGLVASLLGLGAGVVLARLVIAAFEAAGSDLPTTSVLVRPATVVAAFVVGLVVTLVAAVFPGLRATRVPPLAALRDVAIDRSAASRPRVIGGVVVSALGLFLLSAAWRSDGDTDSIPTVGLGAVLLIVGAIVIGPVLAEPTVRFIGVPLQRLRGVTGRLAMENAARNPKRTSATASALLIGVALVSFITVFAASATKSVNSEVDRGLTGDLIVQSEGGFFGPPSGFPALVKDQVAAVEGVETANALGFARAEVTYPSGEKATQFITSLDPVGVTSVFEPRMAEGDISTLTDGGVVVDEELAADNGIALGDTLTFTFPGGAKLDLVVESFSDDLTLLGWFTITRTAYASAVPELFDVQVYAKVAPGFDVDEVKAAVEVAVADTPALEVLDRDGFAGDLAAQIQSFVTVIYALLVLSIVIALIGIANTLSLSINERIRELGLLRAVGMARSQMRSIVRWEAALISTLGSVVGIGIGVLLSWALVTALGGFGLSKFALPAGTLAAIVIMAAALGTLASLRPSSRAAKLPVLEAIATE